MPPTWNPPVITCSAVENSGLEEFWEKVELHRRKLSATGELEQRRRDQQVRWMWAFAGRAAAPQPPQTPAVRGSVDEMVESVRDGLLTPTLRPSDLWELYRSG
ncbi:MAG: hypothetical protein R2716_09155 [Microthrixaceae bacterium]